MAKKEGFGGGSGGEGSVLAGNVVALNKKMPDIVSEPAVSIKIDISVSYLKGENNGKESL